MICFVVTLPGPPTNVELTKVTQTTATLQWTAPKNGTVKQYIIAYLEHDREGSSPNMVRQIQIPQMLNNSPPLIRTLPPKANLFIRPDFSCTEIVKCY
jgi:hypothetical protein